MNTVGTPKGRAVWSFKGRPRYVMSCGKTMDVSSDLLTYDEVIDFHLMTCDKCIEKRSV